MTSLPGFLMGIINLAWLKHKSWFLFKPAPILVLLYVRNSYQDIFTCLGIYQEVILGSALFSLPSPSFTP